MYNLAIEGWIPELIAKNYFNEVDLVVSDMSVNLSGINIKDEEENKELNYSTINLSKKLLKKRGNLLIKTFNNRNLPEIKSLFKSLFNKVIAEKPPASKTSSKEVYLLGLDLK